MGRLGIYYTLCRLERYAPLQEMPDLTWDRYGTELLTAASETEVQSRATLTDNGTRLTVTERSERCADSRKLSDAKKALVRLTTQFSSMATSLRTVGSFQLMRLARFLSEALLLTLMLASP